MSKRCTGCGQFKALKDFYHRPNRPMGIQSRCKVCLTEGVSKRYKANPEPGKARTKKWHKEKYDPQTKRKSHLKKKFGITLEQYNELLEKQNNACAVCLRPATTFKIHLAVDHAHGGPRKGFIRGLLCTHCNRRVIGAHTDPDLLQRAAEYLRQDTGWQVPPPPVKRRKK